MMNNKGKSTVIFLAGIAVVSAGIMIVALI